MFATTKTEDKMGDKTSTPRGRLVEIKVEDVEADDHSRSQGSAAYRFLQNLPLSMKAKLAIFGTLIVLSVLLVALPLSICLMSEEKCGLQKNTHNASATEAANNLWGIQSPGAPAPTPSFVFKQNSLLMQSFEWYMPKDTKHWVRVTNQLGKLAELGVENIWLPPASKNANMSQIGYDVYDVWDLGEFDAKGQVPTNMGTKQELQTLVSKASNLGIGITLDGVFNQRTGGDKSIKCNAVMVNETNRLEPISKQMQVEAWVDFTFPARNGKYSTKTWGCEDFTAVDYDAATGESGIYKIQGKHNDWAPDVSNENGNYDFLLLSDVALADNPSVQSDLLNWGVWIKEELGGLRGFRLDAVKHMSRGFVLDFMENMRLHSTITGDDYFFAAEYWTGDPREIQKYVDELENRVWAFDTPLDTNFHRYSVGEATDLRQVFNNSYLQLEPDKAITYVMTHDTQPGQSLGQFSVEGWFLPVAYSLTLLRQDGYPSLFYGDIYGTYDQAEQKLTPPPYGSEVADLALTRKLYAYGNQTDYFDDPSVVGWTRTGIEDHAEDGLAVIISNDDKQGGSKRMDVGAQHAGETWTDLLDNVNDQVKIDDEGFGTFTVKSRSVSAFTHNKAKGRKAFGKWDPTIYGSK